ncbi:MAG: acyl-[acyl-carrier-protein]--UDP-N-acetylglucosamine O-acyltransferase, partial [Gammaproteobacteria bacterium]|nr:acyl-[acyl-carrier-protein]--UDP-N-acetylglucosamine O-acyltransferase [Gammaproteobacteria bacterium]
DIPPFMLVKGTPGIPFALNLVGLRRRGFSASAISGLKKAFSLMYRQGLSLEELETGLAELVKETVEINLIIELIKNSKRGIARKQNL